MREIEDRCDYERQIIGALVRYGLLFGDDTGGFEVNAFIKDYDTLSFVSADAPIQKRHNLTKDTQSPVVV